MILYAVVWKGGSGDCWHCSDVYEDGAIAEAQLTLNQLRSPSCNHHIIQSEIPNIRFATIPVCKPVTASVNQPQSEEWSKR